MLDTSPALPTSEHFTLECIVPGVYAALAIPQRGAVSNAGIIDLGDGALIFDTFMTPQAATDLRAAAVQLTRGPVRYVVNSHYHADHVLGNSAFSTDIPLISTAITRQHILKHIPEVIKDRRQNRPQAEILLREAQEKLKYARPEQQATIRADIQQYAIQVEASAQLKLYAPTWTFEQALAIYGPARAVEVLSLGGGHTASDAILVLPDVGVIFAADLVFIGRQPWVGDGSPASWLTYLDHLTALQPNVIVPGHGPVGALADLDPLRAYLQALEETLAAELDPEEVETLDLPPALAHLKDAAPWRRNVQALLAQQVAKKTG